ncbi:MAG: tetratricopeptide repeat protein [Deltaproteobacteria bacterium]|nr:tetratricopeptide repeat protein [Deltaproteobacteria bacterium]
MKKNRIAITIFGVFLITLGSLASMDHIPAIAAGFSHDVGGAQDRYTGSTSCRKCHEKFYMLWAPSHHGLAMEPYTAELASDKLSLQTEGIVIGDSRYRADVAGDTGWVIERGPEGEKKYRIDHVMGGKNVYYFLTTLDRGRLQTLPLAYDVNRKEWFDMAASGVRHFPGLTDEPIHWKDWQYTFNTACYGCHVSQVSTNYDLKSDTYHTVWKESGINCETCHGPADEHVSVCESAPKGTVPKDLKIIRGGRDFTHEQNNVTCSSCHAKAVVLTNTFLPGDRFFDHFGLVTLENHDYYPDGRDLGENYTYTSWLMSPCVKSGRLDCLHCHTSSGRYKFKDDEKANQACMPCHKDRVSNPTEHTRHKADRPGNACISCHMPTTEFARMRRTDHSMLPPVPAATMAYKSPNACNLCHPNKDAAWADHYVREWRDRDYQKPLLKRASLVDAARNHNWRNLRETLEYITSKDRDEVFATSLLRLVPASGDPLVVPALLKAIKDPSPLIRSAAATALQNVPTEESVLALVEAASDDYRLVRVRAAAALAAYPNLPLTDADKKKVEAANGEYLASILSRPDQWDSHYNLGNYYLDRGDFKQAVDSYETALKMEPRGVLAMVNEAMAYARMGENLKAENALENALKIAPDNAAANFNMGLLKAEANDPRAAEEFLKAALKGDPQMAQAAYNLGVIISKNNINEAVAFLQKAVELRPNEPKYLYTLAFYQMNRGDVAEAISGLECIISRYPDYADAYILLGNLYEKQGKNIAAEKLFSKGIITGSVPDYYKAIMKNRLEKLRRPVGK